MKCIHHEVGAICSFVTDRGLSIVKLRSKGMHPNEKVPISSIEELLDRSNQLWGKSLEYFLSISEFRDFSGRGLRDTIASFETDGAAGFLLVAYQDGGVISISNKMYPFQRDALSAAWWHPY